MGDQEQYQELKIFVGGVHPDTTKDSLNDHFSQYGFADSYVMMDKATGRSRGFGFVNFKDEHTMNVVLSTDHTVDGTPITCTEYKKGSSKGPSAGARHSQAAPVPQANSNPEMKVFVGGLAQETSKEILDMYFLQYGPADSYIMTDKATGRSRGFGFVNFRDEETLWKVLEAKDHQVDGAAITVTEYSKGSGKGSGNSHGTSSGNRHGGSSGHSFGDSWHDAGTMWPTATPVRAVGMTGPQLNWRSGNMPAHEEEPSDPDAEIKVFVGGLGQDTSKESLNRYFSRWGSADAYVMMDSATGRSRGFGFVNFRSMSTKRAVLAAGPHRVSGQTIECRDYSKGSSKGGQAMQPEPQRRQPAQRRPAAAASNARGPQTGASGQGDTADLLRTIQDQLKMLSSTLTSQVQNKEQAHNLQSAISSVTSALQPVVQQASQGGRGNGGTSEDQLKVFVGGLSQDTTKRSLDDYFSQYGAADSYIMKDKLTGRSRGFGFVNFRDASTKSVVLKLQHRIDNTPVTVSGYKEGSDSSAASHSRSVRQDGGLMGDGGRYGSEDTSMEDDSARIFVGGLPQSATDATLQEAFAAYGVATCEVMMDNVSGRSRGFGFVQFDSPGEAELAISSQPIYIDGKEVQCKECRGKGQSKGKGGGSGRSSPY